MRKKRKKTIDQLIESVFTKFKLTASRRAIFRTLANKEKKFGDLKEQSEREKRDYRVSQNQFVFPVLLSRDLPRGTLCQLMLHGVSRRPHSVPRVPEIP